MVDECAQVFDRMATQMSQVLTNRDFSGSWESQPLDSNEGGGAADGLPLDD